MRIGDTVRLRSGSDIDKLLGEAAQLVGTVGDTWSDDRGERISILYEDVRIYAYDLPAAEFVSDIVLDAASY